MGKDNSIHRNNSIGLAKVRATRELLMHQARVSNPLKQWFQSTIESL